MVHIEIKDYGCEQRNYTCGKKRNQDMHIKKVHTKIKDFGCDQRTYTRSKKQNLDMHTKQRHIKINDDVFLNPF